jgi:hypothetical protein
MPGHVRGRLFICDFCTRSASNVPVFLIANPQLWILATSWLEKANSFKLSLYKNLRQSYLVYYVRFVLMHLPGKITYREIGMFTQTQVEANLITVALYNMHPNELHF